MQSRLRPPLRPIALLAALAALVFAGPALAHGDPSTHALEGDFLYPAVAARPSAEVELRLIGLLRAAQADGYPIKVALVANADDLAYDTSMLRRPQDYAEFVTRELGGPIALNAPLLVITPFGFGVSGRELRGGKLEVVHRESAQELVEGLSISRRAKGDELATTAMAAVRRIARAGGHPLPAHVAPASNVWTPAPGSGSVGAGDGSALDLRLFAALFVGSLVLACAAAELWLRRRRRRPDAA